MNAFLRACVIGQPIQHSLSPLIHSYWLQKLNLPGSYEAINIPPEDLAGRIAALRAEGYNGINVTIPHKQEIIKLCDVVDADARQIGAVNTLHITHDGKLRGSNTDARGFIDHLFDAIPGEDLSQRNVLVLGAGGAARAIIYGLRQAGFHHLSVANRTDARAQKMAAEFGISAVSRHEINIVVGECGLLINTTAGGMTGKDELDFDVAALHPAMIVCDIIYTPRRTALLDAAAQRGCRTVEGLGMLIQQARRSFEIWTGILPDTDAALEKLLYDKLYMRAQS